MEKVTKSGASEERLCWLKEIEHVVSRHETSDVIKVASGLLVWGHTRVLHAKTLPQDAASECACWVKKIKGELNKLPQELAADEAPASAGGEWAARRSVKKEQGQRDQGSTVNPDTPDPDFDPTAGGEWAARRSEKKGQLQRGRGSMVASPIVLSEVRGVLQKLLDWGSKRVAKMQGPAKKAKK
jgi:hypothetical protein